MRATGSEKGSFDAGEVEEVTRSRGDKQIDSPPRSTEHHPFPKQYSERPITGGFKRSLKKLSVTKWRIH